MITITPQGQIYLCKTPLENDYKNQLTFTNLQSQINYFNSVVEKSFDNYTYIKKDNQIKVGCNIDEIISCNYLFYKNTGFTNKYYFCFITNMQYINENCTLISFETDCFQTWQFDINYKRCFVEREHVSNDTIGLHTIDENLNVGEVIEESVYEDTSLSEYYWVAISTSWNPSTENQFSGVTIYNKQIYGNQIFLINGNDLTNMGINLGLFIIKTNGDGHIADINDMFIVPSAVINESELTEHSFNLGSNTCTFYSMKYKSTAESFNITIPKKHSFSNFQPKNNKCFTYPYNYLFVSNNIGNQNIYKYENFNSDNANFKIELSIGIGCSGKSTPLNYKNMSYCDDENIPLGKYPVCGWSADSFINWLTQQAVNNVTAMTNIATSVALAGSGAMATSNLSELSAKEQLSQNMSLANTGISATNSIASLIGGFYSASLQPNIQGSKPTADINWATNRNTFSYRQMRAKNEYMQQIDDYFSMFGYKINLVKIPNITGRRNWNYVKTIECNFDGNIPQTDLNIIKTMFNSGVTLWHNPNTFLDYSQNNNII